MSVAIITAEIKIGATIEQVAYSMMDLAAQLDCNVKFVYEGVEMVVSADHTDKEIVSEWGRRKIAMVIEEPQFDIETDEYGRIIKRWRNL